jgi:hypothetical protein
MPHVYRDIAEDVAFTVLDGVPMWLLVTMTAGCFGVFFAAMLVAIAISQQ